MIVTVTLNPALDRTLEVPDFQVGQHAQAQLVALVPAGKGVNVARGLAALGMEACACGLVGRGELETYRRSLERDGVRFALTPVMGLTRTDTTILDPRSGTTTHLREQGFTVAREEIERLRAQLAETIRIAGRGVTVAFSGSLPPGVELADFVTLLEQCHSAGAKVVADTSGEALRVAAESRCVHTIKPNLEELGECLGGEVSRRDAPQRAAGLLDRVRTVLLTLGEEGAYAMTKEGAVGFTCKVERSRVRNLVGCGDAFLAGWLYGLEMSRDVREALRWAVASGAASACSATAAGYARADVAHYLPLCTPI